MNGGETEKVVNEYIKRHHRHELLENQCSSTLVKHIKAPLHLVWSLVRRFDEPQKYKPFIRCVVKGKLEIGTVREVDVKSGLPATKSTERLEFIDDNQHILSIRIVGGDHRLKIIWISLHVLLFPTRLWFSPNSICFLFQSELFLDHFVAPGDHRRKNRDIGHRVVRGGRAGRQYEGGDMFFRGGFDSMQSQIFGSRI